MRLAFLAEPEHSAIPAGEVRPLAEPEKPKPATVDPRQFRSEKMGSSQRQMTGQEMPRSPSSSFTRSVPPPSGFSGALSSPSTAPNNSSGSAASPSMPVVSTGGAGAARSQPTLQGGDQFSPPSSSGSGQGAAPVRTPFIAIRRAASQAMRSVTTVQGGRGGSSMPVVRPPSAPPPRAPSTTQSQQP